ncbi:plastocyanin/azurin family copper-binding protein [Nitrosopumilus sp.]|uniref:cupredoxin domain-containing protein n=1 Tax=Nitrosopumilus sp. TaxID=2024843 RepID=UPI00247BB6AF|nr:plastocyanin/azurin family copper-binding protein [Nitrosopumilus sp.]MCV0411306.1 cupredoxin domain-containing protein [Nitrosopumilus sp.]
MIKKITILSVIGVALIVILASSLSSNSDDENKETSDVILKGDVIMPTKVSRPGCEVKDICYIPSKIFVEKGKQVTWINEDSAFHSVTSGFYDEPTELFDSGYLDPFESFSLTFDNEGTYDYFCTLHPWMKGQVIVE